MADAQPFPAGTVDWSGENPGMYLKETPDGPFIALVSFFRVVLSPHGRGRGLVLFEAPQASESKPDALNVCVTDNEPLARYLMDNFVAHFGAFRGQPALSGVDYRRLDAVETAGDGRSRYQEHVKGEGVDAVLSWEDLSDPFMVDMPADRGATGKHRMFSLFVDSGRATATVNGRTLRGQSQPRDFAGRQSTTAFLAFSETWVRV
jgi:hypothetical protein